MVNQLLDFVANGDGNYYFENFGEALVYALIGFLIIFAGISLIILIIWLIGLLLRKTDNFAFLRSIGKKQKDKHCGNKHKRRRDCTSFNVRDFARARIFRMINPFSRTERLFGKNAMQKLAASRVAVFGAGGVGGYVLEALARSGVGAIDIIDSDEVSATNINRQILATRSSVGRAKVDVAAERKACALLPCSRG